MLSTTQQMKLEAIVQDINPNLHVEEASLDVEQALEVVLCRDMVCFRPLRIAVTDVDIPAALSGATEAQQALQAYIRNVLQGLL